MRIGLIIPCSYWFAPYIKIYEEVLKDLSFECDIISWDRDVTNHDGIISFRFTQNFQANKFSKIFQYLKFRTFVIKTIERNKYDKLIIFGSQTGIFLLEFLKNNYHKNFVLDYRDLSIDQIFKKRFKKLLDSSLLVAISSSGFKRALPFGYDYLISHNISRENLLNKINCPPPFRNNKIIISTIGAIRDVDANMELLLSLKNHKIIKFQFIGKGSEVIKKFTQNIDSVECMGYYEKESERNLILSSDFINIYMSSDKNSTLLLSNRFYNALICKRPMIVKSNSIQADFVEKYGLGISIENCQDLSQKIQNYVSIFDFVEFSNNCDFLLNEFIADYKHFKHEFEKYLQP